MALVGILSTQLWHEEFCGARAGAYPAETARATCKNRPLRVELGGGGCMTNGETDIRTEMRAFIEENFLYLRPDVELADGDDFLALGIIDSLGFVELVEEVQSRYWIAIDDVEITEENFGSIDAITGFVERKRAAA